VSITDATFTEVEQSASKVAELGIRAKTAWSANRRPDPARQFA
jgi:hypothetical protein